MKRNPSELTASTTTQRSAETLWQTLAGCALFWAGLIVLCWML